MISVSAYYVHCSSDVVPAMFVLTILLFQCLKQTMLYVFSGSCMNSETVSAPAFPISGWQK